MAGHDSLAGLTGCPADRAGLGKELNEKGSSSIAPGLQRLHPVRKKGFYHFQGWCLPGYCYKNGYLFLIADEKGSRG
ncbi:MAG: hypothetical protein CMO40_08430 [Verrucomicrobiaceae bacterium]|nr:hypothetical protein [Verrucomicrobiaceae bacterium]